MFGLQHEYTVTWRWLTVVLLLGGLSTSHSQALAQPPAPAAAKRTEARKIAFLVGVSAYDKEGFRDLDFAENDARGLQAALEELGFKVIVLLGSGSGEGAATRENIWKQFKSKFLPQLKALNKQDIALFAFAGHGRHQVGANREEGHYFCPRDANDGDAETWVSLNQLVDDVEEFSGCRNNLFLVDCCRDNPTRGRGADGEGFRLKKDIVAILFASSYGEQAYELPRDYRLPEGHPLAGRETERSAEHGLFTYFVLEALERDLATDREGLVTWATLVNHVQKWVSRESARLKLGYGDKAQNPNFVGSLKGESPVLAKFEVASERGRKPPAAAQPAAGEMPARPTGNEANGDAEMKGLDKSKLSAEEILRLPALKNSIGVELKLLPAGVFTMGSSEGGDDDETPHQVTLTRPFYLGVYEVTQEQYERVMGQNPSNFKGARNPVEQVSWEDAAEFCQKLSALPEEKAWGRVYRLPTEAEWEYACRAGSTTKYSFGDNDLQLRDHAWFGQNSGGKTHPVGEKQPNDWGLYDMHGNVWEWCSDWYGDYPKIAVSDPVGPSEGSLRVIRGGSWFLEAAFCRSADRYWFIPSYRYYFIGFRVALSSPDIPK